jgi:hypothetical protein
MLVETIKLTELQSLIVESNPNAVWNKMIDFGLVSETSLMPDVDGILDIIYDNVKDDASRGTVVLSHILDVESDGSNIDVDGQIEVAKSCVTTGDLVLLNVYRNNEEAFRLKTNSEENIVASFALLGVVFSFYLLYKTIRKILK